MYQSLLQKLNEASVTAGLSNNLRLVAEARVPGKPAVPKIPRNLALGLGFGLVAGTVLAFSLEMFDDRLHTTAEVQGISTLPILAAIPADEALLGTPAKRNQPRAVPAKCGIACCERPASNVAEGFRVMRTALLLSASGPPPKVILVTSAIPREGKTTVSMNTAVVLAQHGRKVLLVDTDFRNPGVHHAFGVPCSAGLSTLLSGGEEKIFAAKDVPNLDVLPAGPLPLRPAEMLGSEAMKKCLEQWRARYDHIVLDTPPVLSLTDAVLLSTSADAVVLVVRSGESRREAVRQTRDLLRSVHARLCGAVLNAFDAKTLKYYGYQSYYDDYNQRDSMQSDGTKRTTQETLTKQVHGDTNSGAALAL